MKKFFALIWSVLRYILVYFGATMLLGIFIGIYYVVKAAASGTDLINAMPDETKLAIPMTFAVSAISLIFFLIIIKLSHKSINGFLRFRKTKLKNIGMSTVLSLGISAASIGFIQIAILVFPSYNEIAKQMDASINTYFDLICVVILIPIFEEIFFRGIIFNELRKRINIPASVIISALIFAVFHGNIVQGMYTFVLGAIMALVYKWTDSLWNAISIHIVYNLFGSVVWSYVYSQLPYLAVLILFSVLGLALAIFCAKEISRDNSNIEIDTPFVQPTTYNN